MSKHILRKHVFGFTSVSNNVIKILKNDLPALGLYLYLLSLPDNWEFYKTQICKECKIGIKKLEKLLHTLGSFGLVQYGQKRDEQGRFMNFYMDIYDTETLKIKELDKPVQTVQPVGQNCRTAETVGRFGEAIKEELTKEELNKTKEVSCSSSDEPQTEFSLFDYFWNIYPRKQKKKDAEKIWKKNKYEQIATLIFDNVKERIKNEWATKEKEFIPLPSTYLNGERWNDEIINGSMTNNRPHNGLTVSEAIRFALN